MGFNPTDHGANRFLATIDSPNGVIEIVGMQREIDVASLDEQCKWLVGLSPQRGQGSLGHLREGWLLGQVSRAVPLGRAELAAAIETRGRVVVAVGGLIGEMIEPSAAE